MTPFKSMFFSNWCPYRIVFLFDFCDYSSSNDWKLLMAPHDDDNGTQLSLCCFFLSFSSFFVLYKKFQKPQFFLHFTIDAVNMDFLLIHKYVSSYCFGDRWLTLEVHYGNIKATWWNSRLFTFCLLFNKKWNKNSKGFLH